MVRKDLQVLALAFAEKKQKRKTLKEETTRRGKVKRVEPPCVSALAPPLDPSVTAEESER